MTTKLIILASGRGSNALAIHNSCIQNRLDAEIVAIFSDNPTANIINKAKEIGINSAVINPRNYSSKENYEKELVTEINKYDYDLVVLAGYMRILGKTFLDNIKTPIMNIHPSLLPSFPGLHAQKQAIDYGVKVSGCTVHFVDKGLDTGPIIAQASVPVYSDDDEDSLSERILVEEHKLYTKAINYYNQKQLAIVDRTVYINKGNQ
ncbi:phosphoribosylglycinamide formyltransferase [Actinomyces sp. zg-332]|uniref:phosphoribosylglycinamide formyltransferase n=1 Tax=Actinomyces sp. zg-332 TaxID=2708340 RepID=UPI0014223A07|nr:phosphoribosylglycinamide formyltransferase [Actinomyces sp. zg-332]QPK93750.1 phosphoribosylglycinamide formyltransferase [Actinomyces sp. zg-332]